MTSELGNTVELIRSALASVSDAITFADIPGGADPDALSELEPALAGLYAETNGPRCGSIVLFEAEDLDGHQYLCEEVEGGSEEWLTFGQIETDPLMLNRASGVVWWFPDTGTEWWMSEQFTSLAPNPARFFLEYMTGSGYSRIVPMAQDRWYEFLSSLGLAPRTAGEAK